MIWSNIFDGGALNSFRLKAIAKDLNNTVGEEVVVSFIYTVPTLLPIGL